MAIALAEFIVVSAVLFGIGVYGVVGHRNAIRMLFAVEIIINSAVLNFVAFSRYVPAVAGQSIAIFAIALAAAEAAAGLAIVLLTFRTAKEIDVYELKNLKG